MLQFKRAADIVSRMIDITLTGTQRINDFSEGSVILTLYEAVATQIEALYILSRQNIQDGIEQSIYESFNFYRIPEQKAYGSLRISFNSPLQADYVIPTGTQVGSSQSAYTQVYETIGDYFVPAGAVTATIDVYCTQAGTIGNVPAGTLDALLSSMSNIQAVTNPDAFQTGQDEEPLANVKSRFRAYINSLGRATKPAIEYGARTVPEIAGVYVDEQVGYIKVYCHDLNGNLSDNLKEQVYTALTDYKPAGIPLDIFPIVRRSLSVNVGVTVNDKATISTNYQTYITTAVTNHLNAKTVSQDLVLSDLIQLVKNIDPSNIYDVTITGLSDTSSGSLPIENVIVGNDELIRAGVVTTTLQ